MIVQIDFSGGGDQIDRGGGVDKEVQSSGAWAQGLIAVQAIDVSTIVFHQSVGVGHDQIAIREKRQVRSSSIVRVIDVWPINSHRFDQQVCAVQETRAVARGFH